MMLEETDKAVKLLVRAETAFRSFDTARRQLKSGSSLEEKGLAWKGALTEFCKTTKFLEQSARNLGRNRWADNLLREQKDGAILNYLFHARNADNHGIEETTLPTDASLNIGRMFSFAGECRNITLSNVTEVVRLPDGRTVSNRIDGQFDVSNGRIKNGWISTSAPVVNMPEHLHLLPVVDRGQEYAPPPTPGYKHDNANFLLQHAYNWLSKKLDELKHN